MNDPDSDRWPETYDAVESYDRQDAAFYVEEALRAGGPVLELGCGAGRLTIPVAEAGVDITGIDASADKLEAARHKARRLGEGSGSVNFAQAEVFDFGGKVETKFSLAIIPFSGFLSLLTTDDQVRALHNIFRHLLPGGRLAFDIMFPDPDLLMSESDVLYHVKDVTDPVTGRRFVLWRQTGYDCYSQIENVRTVVEELDEQNAVCRRTVRDKQVRYVHRWEMHHLLRLCGFEVLNLFGDFDRSAFDDPSAEMIWVAGARS